MEQLKLDFTTRSPVNVEKLTGQNKIVYELLCSNKTVTLFDGIKEGIFHFHSRISDLRNKVGITIYDRFINVKGSSVKEYSLNEFK